MQVFKFICLHASTTELLRLNHHLGAIYDILQPQFLQYSSQDYTCLAWEAFSSMCVMVAAELNFREASHERAKFLANSLLEEEAKRKEAAGAAPAPAEASDPQ